MKQILIPLVAAASLCAGASAFADTRCMPAPQAAQQVTQEAMLRKLVDQGYTIERFEVSGGGCYKMRGWNKEGQRVKMAHDPANGAVVKMELRDRSTS
jgi:hypothetical protein